MEAKTILAIFLVSLAITACNGQHRNPKRPSRFCLDGFCAIPKIRIDDTGRPHGDQCFTTSDSDPFNKQPCSQDSDCAPFRKCVT